MLYEVITIYSFDITPQVSGKGTIEFIIKNDDGSFTVVVNDVVVSDNDEEADEIAESMETSNTNTTVFTKEQSWKVDFATTLLV